MARSNQARAQKSLSATALSIDELRGVLGQTIRATLTGDVEPGVANAVANLGRVALQAAEASTLAAMRHRLDELEALAATEPA